MYIRLQFSHYFAEVQKNVSPRRINPTKKKGHVQDTSIGMGNTFVVDAVYTHQI